MYLLAFSSSSSERAYGHIFWESQELDWEYKSRSVLPLWQDAILTITVHWRHSHLPGGSRGCPIHIWYSSADMRESHWNEDEYCKDRGFTTRCTTQYKTTTSKRALVQRKRRDHLTNLLRVPIGTNFNELEFWGAKIPSMQNIASQLESHGSYLPERSSYACQQYDPV